MSAFGNSLELEQAVFASAQSSRFQGYHLIARSCGIDDELANQLSRWSPSHNGLIGDSKLYEGFSFFQPSADKFAFSRSFHGGPEYSRRGGLNVVSRMFVCTERDLAGFGDNVISLAKVALSHGNLRLERRFAEHLETLRMPRSSLIAQSQIDANSWQQEIELIRSALAEFGNLAVVGISRPLDLLESLIRQMKSSPFPDFSFSTGLRLSKQRPFRLHFFQQTSPQLSFELRSNGVEELDLSGRVCNSQTACV